MTVRKTFFTILTLAALVALVAPHSGADDRDLLRDQGANPYLFIMLDTSTSMNLQVGGGDFPTVGYGDDPASRIYVSKEALFEVFEPVDNVNFGFATFNQDGMTVRHIHYPYYHETALSAAWPLDWPAPEVNGLTELEDSDGDGLPDRYTSSIQGDPLVFGEEFRDSSGNEIPGGTCADPLDLRDSTGRAQANAFAKLGTFGTVPTEMWVLFGTGKGTPYHVTFVRLSGVPGDPAMSVRLDLREAFDCNTFSVTDPVTGSLTLSLLLDPRLGSFHMVDLGDTGNREESPELWEWADVVGDTVCGGDRPHTGLGWEGNYDGGGFDPMTALDDPLDRDIFCFDDGNNGQTCIDLKYNPTTGDTSDPQMRVLDRGDLLPYDWRTDNKIEFLQRLSPNYPAGQPDFRVTPHLVPEVEQSDFGAYRPVIPNRPPVIAAGESPIANAVVDFQCFYKGEDAVSQNIDCSQSAFQTGWAELACTRDSKFGCRRPYFVLITDGGFHCDGNNPRSDINRLFRDAGVRFWVINVGSPDNCTKGNLHAWLNIPGGEEVGLCVTAQNKQELVAALADILGEIRDTPRAFASAAVPTVQANALQSIFLSSFIPFQDEAVWNGHLDAFLKPVPLVNNKPDTTHPNHLWDAAEEMVTDQYDATNPAGLSSTQRRVFYSGEGSSGQWPNQRQLLATVKTDPDAVRLDLWKAFGLITPTAVMSDFSTDEETLLQTRAELIVSRTLGLKSATRSDGTVVDFLLGDIFHSDPVVIGPPDNSTFFSLDLGEDQQEDCLADDSQPNSNRGYRCFFLRNLFRRRVLVMGSNDGMLHAFNIGELDANDEFDTGSGHEVWAYMPRFVMPTVRQLADGDSHQYTVDGRVGAADVFIDTIHNGTPTANERLWRTVVIGGLREGGAGYYALDVTQPEALAKTDPDPNFFGDERFRPTGTFSDEVPGCTTGSAGCGPVKYPVALWEFSDTTADSILTGLVPSLPILMDEDDMNGDGIQDGNGQPDLGDTWSRANIGAIHVCAAGAGDCADPTNHEIRHVAVFGGGADPLNKAFNPNDAAQVASHTLRGNWLYMLDIETGKVIYKRQLLGAAPSEVALLDSDRDGFTDRIYLGTQAGLIYRVDLLPVLGGTGLEFPQLRPAVAQDLNGDPHDVERITVDSSGDPIWEPEIIFDANFDGTTVLTEPRNFFHRPSVIFVGNLGRFALAIGTGDREDLWTESDRSGRFYLFVDDSDEIAKTPANFPYREDFLEQVTLTEANDPTNTNLLLAQPGRRGWFVELNADERVTSDSFALSGVTFFSAFRPRVDLEDENGTVFLFDPAVQCIDPDFQENTSNTCAASGSSAVFVMNTTNANGFLGTNLDRFKVIDDVFVSSPFTEPAQNKNPIDGDPNPPAPPPPPPEVPRDLFPVNCKFANYAEDIRVVASDTQLESIARVPICIIEKNWKEF